MLLFIMRANMEDLSIVMRHPFIESWMARDLISQMDQTKPIIYDAFDSTSYEKLLWKYGDYSL